MGMKITVDMTKDPDWNKLEGLLGTAKAEWLMEMQELGRELDHLDKVLAAKAVRTKFLATEVVRKSNKKNKR